MSGASPARMAAEARDPLRPLHQIKSGLRQLGLHTVCESARCPNIHECFHRGAATFLILGSCCTRGCGFCAVPDGHPPPPSPEEPEKVARMAREMRLRHVVITSVTRDDLDDGGSAHFASTIRAVRTALPEASVEVLTPDFGAIRTPSPASLERGPTCSITTSRRWRGCTRRPPAGRLPPVAGGAALRAAALPEVVTKSGFMVGLGEEAREVEELLADLRAAGVEIVTIGQYLQPSRRNLPVVSYVPPEQFEAWRGYALSIGFRTVAERPAGPQFLYGRGGRGDEAVLNIGLALASALLLILTFPRFDFAFLAAVALAPLLVALARESRPLRRFLLGYAAGVVYWFGTCYWIQFVLQVHGGMGFCGKLGSVPPVLSGQGAAHGSVRAGGGRRHEPRVCHSGGGRAMGGHRTDAWNVRLRLAGPGQRGRRHERAHAPGAVHGRLRAVVRFRHAEHGARRWWRSGGAGANWPGCWRCPCSTCCLALPDGPAAATSAPSWCSPTSRRPRSGPSSSVAAGAHAPRFDLPAGRAVGARTVRRACWCGPKCRRRLTTTATRSSARRPSELARLARTNFLFGAVAHTPAGRAAQFRGAARRRAASTSAATTR